MAWKMNLTILIPTYNRANDLMYNLRMLEDYILRHSLEKVISVLVSNNCSSDNTGILLTEYEKKSSISLTIYHQTKNVGLEKNALFCLEQATSDFVMYLGDDDYLDERYLVAVVKSIEEIDSLTCVIPSFVGILPNKEVLPFGGRDVGLVSSLYKKGFHSCFVNSWRGHQLSGLTFKRIGLLSAYKKNNVSNIYPFIYFVCYSALNGKIYHIPEYPVRVTQPGQNKKDWGYGADGLVSEIFDNYKKIGVNIVWRSSLELQILRKQPFRFLMYFADRKASQLLIALWKISFGKNTSILSSMIFPVYLFMVLAKISIKKVFRK